MKSLLTDAGVVTGIALAGAVIFLLILAVVISVIIIMKTKKKRFTNLATSLPGKKEREKITDTKPTSQNIDDDQNLNSPSTDENPYDTICQATLAYSVSLDVGEHRSNTAVYSARNMTFVEASECCSSSTAAASGDHEYDCGMPKENDYV